MSYPIEEIEGIGGSYGEKLKAAGINNTDNLLAEAASAPGRKALEEKCGITSKLLLTWANRADLMRIKGIGKQFSELLECSGVDTIKELRNRNAVNLAAKMAEVNAEKKLAKSTPNEAQATEWIEAAKSMEPMISH